MNNQIASMLQKEFPKVIEILYKNQRWIIDFESGAVLSFHQLKPSERVPQATYNNVIVTDNMPAYKDMTVGNLHVQIMPNGEVLMEEIDKFNEDADENRERSFRPRKRSL